MEPKKNDYIIVRRVEKSFADIDVEEFEQCVRGHRNAGYRLHGDLLMVATEKEFVIAQALQVTTPDNTGGY